MRIQFRLAVLTLAVLLSSSRSLGQQLSKEEAGIVHSIDEEAPAAVALLEKIVNINSGTFNPAGVVEVGKVLEGEFQALGFTTHWVPMDAVQRARHRAKEYGYLRTSGSIVVSGGTYIDIVPADPAFIVVPVYDLLIVFAPPRPGFVIGAAIGFGFGVAIGAWFHPWGWGATRIVWSSHTVFINSVRWERDWANRHVYVHPYPGVRQYAASARVEHHELVQRSANERAAAHAGHEVHEEHEHQGGHHH